MVPQTMEGFEMNLYTVTHTQAVWEISSINIEANSEAEAAEKFRNGDFDPNELIVKIGDGLDWVDSNLEVELAGAA